MSGLKASSSSLSLWYLPASPVTLGAEMLDGSLHVVHLNPSVVGGLKDLAEDSIVECLIFELLRPVFAARHPLVLLLEQEDSNLKNLTTSPFSPRDMS